MPGLGGSYSEGIIGYPRYLNPVLAAANDADQDLSRVIFSGLLKLDTNGGLIPDLAESYSIGENGKVYDFFLRRDALWHDGMPVTADDVIFTIQTIQNPDYRSPLRVNWAGIDVEKLDDYTIRFHLKNAYAPFPYNATFGILPKHIWQNISAADFALNERNLKPVGSGPYVFQQLEKNKDGAITSIGLSSSKNYYFNGPFIQYLTFRFYADENKAVAALRKSEVQGLSFLSPANYADVKNNFRSGINIFELSMPRYFSLFINQSQSKALAEKNVRVALATAIDKQKLIDDVLNGFGQKIDSPFIPGMLGYSDQVKTYNFDTERAKNLLDGSGWIDSNGDGIREKTEKGKEPVALEFSIVTTPWQELSQTAEFLKNTWGEIGAKITIETKETSALVQENIRPRQYQMLLFGELLNIDPDPFAFWHSSQKKDPGQNLSVYENAKVDAILQDARQDLDPASRAKKYQEFSQLIAEDLPAIFLYAPDYLYPISDSIRGADLKILVTPSDRFSQIENWYIKTTRAWKK